MCFYKDANYQGNSHCASPGQVATKSDLGRRDLMDEFTSVTVPVGMWTTSYNRNLNGKSRVYTENIPTFDNTNWNDDIISFTVQGE